MLVNVIIKSTKVYLTNQYFPILSGSKVGASDRLQYGQSSGLGCRRYGKQDKIAWIRMEIIAFSNEQKNEKR